MLSSGLIFTIVLVAFTPICAFHIDTQHKLARMASHGRFKTNLSEASMKASEDNAKEIFAEMPWGERQEWALKDNIGKYIVDIPQLKTEHGSITYAMWRALTRDVFELAGYEVEFIRQKYANMLEKDDEDSDAEGKKKPVSPPSLPLLDNFEFQSNGGISGKIEGLRGIADGTTVQTSPLAHIELTVPRGYVITDDGSSAYELGTPLSEESYSLDIAKMNINVDDVAKTMATGAKGTVRAASDVAVSLGDQETTNMLVNLGATTAILLGGATAVNMLSHHLTVNVFWV